VVALGNADGEAAGYDLLGAFVGSEGCFGIALDVTVRLTPDPEAVRTLLASFATIEDAARATSAVVASGIVPAALEVMDRPAILAVEASVYAAGYPTDCAAVLLCEVDGPRPDSTTTPPVWRRSAAPTARSRCASAADAAERQRLWQGRKKAFGAMGRLAPSLVLQDAVVPRTKLPAVLAAVAAIGARHGVRVANFFHAGDGNLHPTVPYDASDPDESRRVHLAMGEIMQACVDAGGTITGEHGVGLDKLPYMERLFDPPTLAAMCRLREVFDPDRRANPGKVVPVHACREWRAAPGARVA
jgi:FAD/FMN-containing dehydrogenase